MKHSPTPWKVDGNAFVIHIRSSDGIAVSRVISPHMPPLDDINAAHIVKCVNLHEELVGALEKAIRLANVPEHIQDDTWDGGLKGCQAVLTKSKQEGK